MQLLLPRNTIGPLQVPPVGAAVHAGHETVTLVPTTTAFGYAPPHVALPSTHSVNGLAQAAALQLPAGGTQRRRGREIAAGSVPTVAVAAPPAGPGGVAEKYARKFPEKPRLVHTPLPEGLMTAPVDPQPAVSL